MNRIRKSGINILGDIPWGSHISMLYSSTEEFNFLAPLIKTGLLNNELCIWVYSSTNISREEILDMLSKDIPNIDFYINSGQLLIKSYERWYINESGIFNGVLVNKKWTKLLEAALNSGYDGIRAIGDTHWLERYYYEQFIDYDQSINTLIMDFPYIVICLYDFNKISKLVLANIIANHSLNIIREDNEYKLIGNVELMRKNKQLVRSEENYYQLLKVLPIAVFIHDKEKVYYYNESAEKLLGKESGKLSGSTMAELISEEYRDSFSALIEKNIGHISNSQILTCSMLNGNGNDMDVEITLTNYIYQGMPAVLSVVRDVSTQRKISNLEKDIQKSREYEKLRTEFFCNISHELKTPISIILSVQELIGRLYSNNLKDTRLNKYYNMINRNCYRLLKIANNILDITKLDSNSFEMHPLYINIIKVLKNITLSAADYADKKGISMSFSTNIIEKNILCDPNHIERVLLNLLSNAIKFTHNGGSVLVTAIDQGDSILISVKDNGIGIPKAKLDVIFDRFQQIDKSLARENEGSGIGLSLVKLLVENMGGKITVQSEYGVGTEFLIELPCIVDKLATMQSDNNYINQNPKRNNEVVKLEFSDIYY
jgi:two-component system phosphate regulon sensor histidine kinase PhoR